jgi:hypothetical protein
MLTWLRGSPRVVDSVFEVMTQVDLGLTNVSGFDSADSAISVNDANKKPGASQYWDQMYLQLSSKCLCQIYQHQPTHHSG